MALNIDDPETEKLAAEVAELIGDTKQGAVLGALREKRERLESKPRRQSTYPTMREWMEKEIWPHIPPQELGKPPLTKAEVEEILGIGPEGY
jgi:antitoxin VapB